MAAGAAIAVAVAVEIRREHRDDDLAGLVAEFSRGVTLEHRSRVVLEIAALGLLLVPAGIQVGRDLEHEIGSGSRCKVTDLPRQEHLLGLALGAKCSVLPGRNCGDGDRQLRTEAILDRDILPVSAGRAVGLDDLREGDRLAGLDDAVVVVVDVLDLLAGLVAPAAGVEFQRVVEPSRYGLPAVELEGLEVLRPDKDSVWTAPKQWLARESYCRWFSGATEGRQG